MKSCCRVTQTTGLQDLSFLVCHQHNKKKTFWVPLRNQISDLWTWCSTTEPQRLFRKLRHYYVCIWIFHSNLIKNRRQFEWRAIHPLTWVIINLRYFKAFQVQHSEKIVQQVFEHNLTDHSCKYYEGVTCEEQNTQ